VSKAYIGTSGWNYKDWRGRFYPKGVPAREWLRYLSREFDTVEVNYPFYRLPTEETVRNWQETVPKGFRFAVKLWRGITHYRKLVRCEDFLDRYFRIVDPIRPSARAPLLIQLPPNQSKDIEKLDRFLSQARERALRSWKLVVEFRHDSWLSDDVYRMLNRQRTAICLHDMPDRAATRRPNNVNFVYLRRHGTTGKYQGTYSDEDLRRDAEDIRQWLAQKKTVYVYFNNDIAGHAVEDARRLRALVTPE
jgi:uncharacterized protein YecE (DUF72 family)